MGARRSSGTLVVLAVSTRCPWPPGLVRAGLASRPPVPAGLARGRPAALHPALRRLGAAASAVATAMDRNRAAMAWLRAGRGVAGRLGGGRGGGGWGGRRARAPGPGRDPA